MYFQRCFLILKNKHRLMRLPCCLLPSVTVYPHIVARQRLRKNVIAAMNTHGIIENLLDAAFSMRFVSY
jgi:hypothetical protein